ncbi:MAG: site-specific DNA-methyltransferase, partial [Caldilineae bacterium]
TVHFKLQAADVEVNNVKGDKRFFVPVLDAISIQNTSLIIPFTYRPLTRQEESVYGSRNQQEKIIAEALETIPSRLQESPEALAALAATRQLDAKGKPVTHLAHHLRRYTARNTRDFFIHKDLKGFLTRELDFYLKNEVLNLEELHAADADIIAERLHLMQNVRRVGTRIIDFLAQMEDLQKALWEKKKFVTETFYVITVGNIPEAFYPEIAANEAQWQEWQELGMLHDESGMLNVEERTAFLIQHSALPLDTRHFAPDFTDRLLASFANLDAATDGLLIHSENWQALHFLGEKYRGRVKCVYMDPPYNTGKDDFVYKDGYRHSSWMSMMADRVGPALLRLLRPDGVLFASISDHESAALKGILDLHFGEENFLANIVWNSTKTVTNTALISVNHTHNLVYARDARYFVQNRHHFRLPDPLEGFANPDNDPRGPWKADPFQVGGVRPNQQYAITNPKTGKVYRPNPGCSWKNDHQTFQRLLAEGRIIFGKTGEGAPLRKRYLFEAAERGRVSTTWWDDVETTADGTRTLQHLLGVGATLFTNPKPVSLIARMIQLGTHEADQIVMDHFAGSGATGHAVIHLNREDGGQRKFVLVEMGPYFDTVLLPRIKKVIFSPEWKHGKPTRPATREEYARGPRIIKVLRLESYEDALNNISFDEESGAQALKLFGQAYLLHYMLRWEARQSETFLNIEKLQSPFSYRLLIHREGETQAQIVDLPETFNYLMGLDIETRQVYQMGGHEEGRQDEDASHASRPTPGLYLVYRGTTRAGRRVVVIWRETEGWQEADYLRDSRFVAAHIPLEDADEIYVNGDSCIPRARPIEAVFRVC